MKATKVGKSLTNGPSKRDGSLDLKMHVFPGYGSLDDILEIFENTRVPDFSEMQAEIAKLQVIIPDDPMDVGFTQVKKLISDVANYYRLLSSYRGEVIGIKTEWLSLGFEFDQLLKLEQTKLIQTDGYAECKNVDTRKAYIDGHFQEFYTIERLIDTAKQRCNDFVEFARIKGKELDRIMEALHRQLDIIKLQVKLGHILPREIEDN